MIDILKALAEETRLRIFAQIIKGDMCVCEIEECLELTAQWAYYKVSDTFITENKELYNYLIQKTKELKTFESDSEKYNKCKSTDMCSCKKDCKEDLQ